MSQLWRRVLDALQWAWRQAVRAVLFVLKTLAALILIFEEWGWRPLVELLGVIAHWRPIARLELLIAGLPPWPALLVFAAPSLLLFPVKLVGLWLLAQGKVLSAGLLLAVAKVVSTALVARIFLLTKPALMRLAWFAWAYGKFMPWKEALVAWVRQSWTWRYGRMLKSSVRKAVRSVWIEWKPTLIEWRDVTRGRLRLAASQIRGNIRRVWNDVRELFHRQ